MPPRLSISEVSLRRSVLQAQALCKPSVPLQSTFFTKRTRATQLVHPFESCRTFSQSSSLFKKKGRVEREKEEEAASKSSVVVEDPHDFSILEVGLQKVLDKLRDDLSKLKTGGRFNPEVIENIRVALSKDSKGTERLGDLAQVLPKGGRNLMILVGEKDHVKPIMSAIQGSKDLNLQPQPDPHNASQLNVPIPPPTKESRDQALAAASRAGDIANTGVRNARAVIQKRFRAMELSKAARPDDLKKAHKAMEKVVENGVVTVKKIVDAARKAMEQA